MLAVRVTGMAEEASSIVSTAGMPVVIVGRVGHTGDQTCIRRRRPVRSWGNEEPNAPVNVSVESSGHASAGIGRSARLQKHGLMMPPQEVLDRAAAKWSLHIKR